MNEREILDQLVTEGKVTEKDIIEVSGKILTSDSKELVDMLHTKYCNRNHDSEECEWYIEADCADEWKRPFHLAWVVLFNDFLASTKLIKFVPEAVREEPSG